MAPRQTRSEYDSSGTLAVRDGQLIYESAALDSWRLPVADIRLIGEWTDESGPFADDYFLVFVTADGQFHQASFYAQGMLKALIALEGPLDRSLRTDLAGSTDLASRIVHPAELEGRPLYRFLPQPIRRPWRWLKHRLGIRRVTARPTAEVTRYLAGR